MAEPVGYDYAADRMSPVYLLLKEVAEQSLRERSVQVGNESEGEPSSLKLQLKVGAIVAIVLLCLFRPATEGEGSGTSASIDLDASSSTTASAKASMSLRFVPAASVSIPASAKPGILGTLPLRWSSPDPSFVAFTQQRGFGADEKKFEPLARYAFNFPLFKACNRQ